MTMTADIIRLIISVALTLLAASVGAYFTSWNVQDWYQNDLLKPVWTPSGRVISTVWTVLFTLMACSMWLVSRRRTFEVIRLPLSIFLIQLVLNVTWSFLFFGIKSPGLAMIELIALLGAVAATIRAFYPFSPLAALLLIPYFCWIIFAGILNFQIWRLN
jgi:tryptophan-rich sensory protein